MSYLFGFQYIRPEVSLRGVGDAVIEAAKPKKLGD